MFLKIIIYRKTFHKSVTGRLKIYPDLLFSILRLKSHYKVAFESDSERNCYQILLSRQVLGNIYTQQQVHSCQHPTHKRTWFNTRFESEETKRAQRWRICWPAWRTTSSLRRRTSTTGPSSSFIRSPVGSAWSGPPSGLLLSTLETLSGAILGGTSWKENLTATFYVMPQLWLLRHRWCVCKGLLLGARE